MSKMTKERLEEFLDSKRERETLLFRIERLEQEVETPIVVTVSASIPEMGYKKGPVKVRGIDQKKLAHIRRLRMILRQRDDRLAEERLEIELYIPTIPKSVIRQLVELHYIEGLSWVRASRMVYGYPCESRARNAVDRFFKDIF